MLIAQVACETTRTNLFPNRLDLLITWAVQFCTTPSAFLTTDISAVIAATPNQWVSQGSLSIVVPVFLMISELHFSNEITFYYYLPPATPVTCSLTNFPVIHMHKVWIYAKWILTVQQIGCKVFVSFTNLQLWLKKIMKLIGCTCAQQLLNSVNTRIIHKSADVLIYDLVFNYNSS